MQMLFKPTLHKLNNGVSVILDSMDLETVSVKVSFATGSRDENATNSGITHFCEHMFFKGTPRFASRNTIRYFLENLGGVLTAGTSGRFLMFEGRIIAENTFDLLDVMADLLKNSSFDSEKIEIERDVILDELRRAHGANSRKYADLILTNLFGYSDFRTLGTAENIKSFTREQMLDWLKQRLSAQNCTICISGRIDDKDVLLRKLEELFSFLPNHNVSTNTELNYTPFDKFLHEPSVKNVWIDILFPYLRPDTYENIPANVAESKFHKYLVQELNEVIRQQNGLVYGLGMSAFGNEYNGVHGIHTETSPENLEKTVALIAQTAYRVYTHTDITQQILDRFFNIHKLANADFLESPVRRRDVLVGHYFDFGRLYDYNRMIEIDKNINVADVMNSSRGFFDGPMSIMSFGAEHNLDLRKIWIDNFK